MSYAKLIHLIIGAAIIGWTVTDFGLMMICLMMRWVFVELFL